MADCKAQGNGGFAGEIDYVEMAESLIHGYGSGFNGYGPHGTGHRRALGDRPSRKSKDFGYRAIHEMTVAAKAVVGEFYGTAMKHSYFSGCSKRRPPGADGSTAFSGGLRWHPRRSAGQLLDASADRSGVERASSHQRSGELYSSDKLPAIAPQWCRPAMHKTE